AQPPGRGAHGPDLGPFRGEAHGGGAPDAARRAGDKRDLAREAGGPRALGAPAGLGRHQIAATAMISTRYFGVASRASTVARAGVLAGSIHASHAAFMSLCGPMFSPWIVAE